MKKRPPLFEDKVSSEYRDQVFRQAKAEFAAKSPSSLSLRSFLKTGLATAGVLGLSWIGLKRFGNDEEKVSQLALLDTDPEMLENLDWLDDLDVISELEELEEWQSS